MKVDLSNKKYSAYDHLSAELDVWAFKNNKYGDLIVDIWTSILGADRICAVYGGMGVYDFTTDWYEGGELEILAICPVNELGELKYKL